MRGEGDGIRELPEAKSLEGAEADHGHIERAVLEAAGRRRAVVTNVLSLVPETGAARRS
jgi:hypothetical protein